jgi:2-polyprenyl-6-methoxyphenol hydroxylase-like FAD-dependent oxidoreductase
MPKPILISGAGLSGLLLARSLRSRNIPFELYERDSAGSSRSQGYRIRLSSQGLNALEAVLSPDAYADFKAGCSDNGSGQILGYDAITMEEKHFGGGGPPKGGGQVLGVDRAFLRNQLLRGIEEVTHFKKACIGYEVSSEGVTAKFADGTTSPEGSMLVGADGVYSKITKQLTDSKLKVYDTGARMIHGSSPRSVYEPLAKGRFAAFSITDNSNENRKIAMITNVRDEPDSTHFGFVLVGGPGTFSAPNDDFSVTGQAAVDIAVDVTKDWAEGVRPILREQKVEDAAFLKMSTSSPDGVPEWSNEARVTIMGDAVHAMTPGMSSRKAVTNFQLAELELIPLYAMLSYWDGLSARGEAGKRISLGSMRRK